MQHVLVVCSARGNLLSKQLFIEARKQMVEECRLSAGFLVLCWSLLLCHILKYLLSEITNTVSKTLTPAFICVVEALM